MHWITSLCITYMHIPSVGVHGVNKLTPPPHLAFNSIRTPRKYFFLQLLPSRITKRQCYAMQHRIRFQAKILTTCLQSVVPPRLFMQRNLGSWVFSLSFYFFHSPHLVGLNNVLGSSPARKMQILGCSGPENSLPASSFSSDLSHAHPPLSLNLCELQVDLEISNQF